MNLYMDTGVLLKLYTLEPESPAVRDFVVQQGAALPFHSFHKAECTSALQLKVFRGECAHSQAQQALADIEDDVHRGVLCTVMPDWGEVWDLCVDLASRYAAETGCRTLDTLHIACMRRLAMREIVTTDLRQRRLAEKVGLKVVSPLQ